jgi:hypothetical protein
MKRLLAIVVALVGLAAPGVAGERPTDVDIKKLSEAIDKGFDVWKDALEKNNLDDAKLTSASGTVDVKRFLNDFENEIHAFKDRFGKPDSAGPEATALLRRASDVERRYRANPSNTGAAAWSAMSAQFEQLADAYGTPWPIESTETRAMRLSDQELGAHLSALEQNSKQAKNEFDRSMSKDKSTPKTAREEVKRSFDGFTKQVKTLREDVKDRRPAQASAVAVLTSASTLGQRGSGLSLSPTGQSVWHSVDQHCEAIARAFGLPWPQTIAH